MKPNIYKFLSVIFIALIINPGCNDHITVTPMPPDDLYGNQHTDTYYIPFEVVDSKIIFAAKINGVEGNICFEMSRRGVELSTYYLDKLTKSSETLEFNDENYIYPSIPHHFEIGYFTVDLPSNQFATVNSQNGSDQYILAFIGRDFFKYSELVIDFNTKVITVSTNSHDSPIASIILIE